MLGLAILFMSKLKTQGMALPVSSSFMFNLLFAHFNCISTAKEMFETLLKGRKQTFH